MKHSLQISVSKKPQANRIVAYKTVSIREKLLRRLLGTSNKVTILVPGSSVASVSINEVQEGGAMQ